MSIRCAAINYALAWGMPRIQRRVTDLAAMLRQEFGQIPRVRVRDLGVRHCGITTLTVDGVEAARVKAHLASQDINVSVSRTSSTRLDMDDRGLGELLRASVHYYNTEEEIALFTQAVRACVG